MESSYPAHEVITLGFHSASEIANPTIWKWFLKFFLQKRKTKKKNKASPNYIFIAKKARYLLYFELRTYSVKT